MAWNFTADRPIYGQISEILRQNILNGTYGAGTRLPTVRDLATDAAVNPNTVQKAFSELEQEGLITTQRNTGRMVTTDQAVLNAAREEMLTGLTRNYLRQMQQLGSTKTDAIRLIEKLEKES